MVLTYSILDDASFWKFEVELPQLNLTDEILSRNFNTLSPGEQTKILLALMFVEEGTFKLIDEPTNHLDITGRDIVANYLKRKSGFIVVSHDKTMINQTVNHVLSIDRSKIQLLKGNYDTWENKFKQDNLSEAKQNFKLNKQIKNLQQTAERLNGWSNRAENEKYAEFYKGQHHVYIDKGFLGHKAAKLMKRSKNALRRVESSIEEKQGLLQNIDKNPKLTLNYEPFYHDNILTVNQLVLERCNRALVQNPISFNIKQGQQLVISGSNGTGKSSLLQAIRGQLSIVKSGKIAKSRGLKVSYLEQSFAEVRGSMLEYTQSYQIDLLEMLNMLKKN